MKKKIILVCFSIFGLASLILTWSWSNSDIEQNETNTASQLEKMVSATLHAYGFSFTQTAANSFRETQSALSDAVEVTQSAQKSIKSNQDLTTGLPDEHYIWNIWGHRQYYPIGCEASVTRDWAGYFGVEVTESNFQFQLPISDNPDYGFVGVVTDPWGQVPPYSYGVHAFPVANLLRSGYGMKAIAVRGFTITQLKSEIAAGRPVIAWVIGNCVGGIPFDYMDKLGRHVTVAAYEHVVIVTGYNKDSIRYMNNGHFYDIPTRYFENSWKVLGNMVIYLEP
jgi:uncharacterized protein YvpB